MIVMSDRDTDTPPPPQLKPETAVDPHPVSTALGKSNFLLGVIFLGGALYFAVMLGLQLPTIMFGILGLLVCFNAYMRVQLVLPPRPIAEYRVADGAYRITSNPWAEWWARTRTSLLIFGPIVAVPCGIMSIVFPPILLIVSALGPFALMFVAYRSWKSGHDNDAISYGLELDGQGLHLNTNQPWLISWNKIVDLAIGSHEGAPLIWIKGAVDADALVESPLVLAAAPENVAPSDEACTFAISLKGLRVHANELEEVMRSEFLAHERDGT